MRIISKYHDYYDSVMKYVGDDPDVFVRNVSEVVLPFNEISNSMMDNIKGILRYSPNQSRPFTTEVTIVGFCGKVYPALRVTYDKPKCITLQEDTFYTVDQYRKFINTKITDKKFKEYYFTDHSSKYSWRRWDDSDKYISSYLDEWHGTDKFAELFIKLKSPMFTLTFTSYASGKNGFKFEVNPPLGVLKFHKVIDTYTAYQELEMYYFGVLGCTEKEIINISDKDMINQKGFDKMSFKKFPTKRNGKRIK